MKDGSVDLWALDEVHFQQQGSRCRMWVPPETKDPIVYHHPTRKSVGYFGAVRLRDGKFFYRRENGKFNGESFWAFHKALRETSGMDPHRSASCHPLRDGAPPALARVFRQQALQRFPDVCRRADTAWRPGSRAQRTHRRG